MAQIVFVSKFILASKAKKKFTKFIDYVARDDATTMREDVFEEYNDYMGNAKKTTGLFDNWNDALTENQKQNYKDVFSESQKKDGTLWQHVLSFDNDFLVDNNIFINSKLDSEKIMQASRKAMNALLKSEGMIMHNVAWTAAIHYNTDNIHVHFAVVEKNPTVNKIEKSMLSKKSITKFKSEIGTSLVDRKLENEKISNLIRNDIKNELNLNFFRYDFEKLYKNIEKKYNKNYRNLSDNDKKLVDDFTNNFLNYSKKNIQLDQYLEENNEHYEKLYDESDATYKKNKLDELKKTIGNQVVKELNDVHKNIPASAVKTKKNTNKNSENSFLKKYMKYMIYYHYYNIDNTKEKALNEYDQMQERYNENESENNI